MRNGHRSSNRFSGSNGPKLSGSDQLTKDHNKIKPSWFALCKPQKTESDLFLYEHALKSNPTPSSKSSQLTKIIFDHDDD